MIESQIKLGRVSKNIEDAISTSLIGDVFIYISGKNLKSFAICYPKDYLRRLEVVKDIIIRPHYASYDKEEGIIYLFRAYYKNGIFKTYVIKIKKEDCWEFLSLNKAIDSQEIRKLDIRELDFKKKKH